MKFKNEANPEAVAVVISEKRTVANAAWWGFGEQDSTAPLQAAIDSGVDKLVLPHMLQDWIVEPLFLNSDNQDIFFDPGVVVMAKKGAFRGRNDSLFTAEHRSNITLRGYGATLRMRKKYYQSPPCEKAEWHADLTGLDCQNVTILGLTIRDTGGDGIYVARSLCKDIIIRDVICDNNHRQGMSVTSAENLLVENCVFSNTVRTSPMADIDLEPNQAKEKMVNIRIRNCIFDNNSMMRMHMNLGHLNSDSPPVSVLWGSNYVRGGEIGIHVTGTTKTHPRD